MTDFAERRRMMVDNHVRTSDVTKFPIIAAMLAVPRELFVPVGLREAAYLGENLPLAPGRVLLDPRTLGKMLDLLDIQPDEVVLDVGCGTGYAAALLARLADTVIAVEEDPALAREAEALLAAEGADNVAVLTGPLAAGAPQHGPYDAILVEGAVEEMPEALTAQLKEGGRIASLFSEGPLQVCRMGVRAAGRVGWRYGFTAGAPVLPGFARKPAFVF